MAIMRWRPYRDLAEMAAEMNRLMNPSETGRQEECLMGSWVPPVDIYEDEEQIRMVFEVPGIKRDELEVEAHDGTLSVRGSRSIEHEDRQDNYRRIERSYGSFCRTFNLPDRILEDKISAKVKNGLLEVVLPKAEEAKPKKVSVEVE